MVGDIKLSAVVIDGRFFYDARGHSTDPKQPYDGFHEFTEEPFEPYVGEIDCLYDGFLSAVGRMTSLAWDGYQSSFRLLVPESILAYVLGQQALTPAMLSRSWRGADALRELREKMRKSGMTLALRGYSA